MNILFLIISIAVFLIVLICSLRALSEMSIFGAGSRIVLAVCVAGLAALGLKTHGSGTIDFVLLPYAALGLSLLGVFLLLALIWLWQRFPRCRRSSITAREPGEEKVVRTGQDRNGR